MGYCVRVEELPFLLSAGVRVIHFQFVPQLLLIFFYATSPLGECACLQTSGQRMKIKMEIPLSNVHHLVANAIGLNKPHHI